MYKMDRKGAACDCDKYTDCDDEFYENNDGELAEQVTHRCNLSR